MPINLKNILLAICAFLFASGTLPLQAQEGTFLPIAPETELRLIASGAPDSEGKIWGAIEIDMPPTTKTYWRVPGETGIPLIADWTASIGIEDVQIYWPMPERDAQSAYVDHVYHGHLVLPVELTLSAHGPHIWNGDIRLGICDEMCVPASASVSLPLEVDNPHSAVALRIRQARAEVPLEISAEDLFLETPRYDTDTGQLSFKFGREGIVPQSLIVATDDLRTLFSAPVEGPDELVSVTLLAPKKAEFVVPDDVYFLIDSDQGAFISKTGVAIAPTMPQ